MSYDLTIYTLCNDVFHEIVWEKDYFGVCTTYFNFFDLFMNIFTSFRDNLLVIIILLYVYFSIVQVCLFFVEEFITFLGGIFSVLFHRIIRCSRNTTKTRTSATTIAEGRCNLIS